MEDEKGYTLIELLAVVVILAIIAAIAVLSMSRLIEQSKEKAFVANAHALKSAADLFIKDKTAREEPVASKITYLFLYNEGMIEAFSDPFTQTQLEPSTDSFVLTDGKRVTGVCLKGHEKKLCGEGADTGLASADLAEENIKNK
ncbi:hypothetical protein A8F95_01425 [Bacillus wudalianchiensis]|uniref:Pilus assembly protein PilE n=2 Tax=Pseudobacillus wudalianchiensis TaxID=1743143 RepID=A0A1B9BA65_9BACI|nr:hypothetical protein A8F95_01425 [Bacillus wudalianchiensis]